MANLCDYFANKGEQVFLINDIIPEKGKLEYCVSNEVTRYFLDQGKLSGLKKNWHRIHRLRKLILNEKPDVIISFMGPPNIRMLVSTIGLNVKKIVSVRNDPYKEYGTGIKSLVAKIIFLLADGCVFQTSEAREYFFESTQKNSRIIFNPVNPKFYEHTWNGKGKDIVVIGRLQAQKNPLLALDAFIKIADDYPETNLLFFGDEELKEEILLKAKEKNLSKRVLIMGKTDRVEDVLENAAIYVLSSDYEGMPNALMEAMAVGVPVISTDCPCGGPRALIRNKEQGLLVPCRDIAGMEAAMRTLLDNKELCRKMSKAEQERAKNFTPELVLANWEDFIE